MIEPGEVGWSDFEPTYFDVGDINGSLGLIFPPDDDELARPPQASG